MAVLKTESLPLPFSLPAGKGNFPEEKACPLYLFLPETAPRAILQICHGMCEYFLRYRPFAEWLSLRGILVCGIDHPGHGQKALERNALGRLPEGRNLEALVEAQYAVFLHMRKRYRHLPYLLLGHSMGSFVARKCITEYPDAFDGVLLLGTAAADRSVALGEALARLISLFGRKHTPSRFLMRLAFGHYNDRFPGETGSAWLSRRKENVRAHDADPLCRFYFDCEAMVQVFGLLREINREEWLDRLPLSLPLFLLSGEEDPVGGFGEGIRQIFAKMEERELCFLREKRYPGDRHEILNEEDRETVYADILAFLDEVAEGVNSARTEHFGSAFGKGDSNEDGEKAAGGQA